MLANIKTKKLDLNEKNVQECVKELVILVVNLQLWEIMHGGHAGYIICQFKEH